MIRFALGLVLCIASVGWADVEGDLQTIYTVTPAKIQLNHDGELARRTLAVLQKQSKWMMTALHPWKEDAAAKLMYGGASGENDIRPNAHCAFGWAVLYRATGDQQARDKSIATLRFLLWTHGAGGKKCADGKLWRNQWQSALWAYSAGKAAWLLWDELDPELRWLAARMICDEADRYIDRPPPMQIKRDTKAEENAWNSTVIALAFNMFPKHPHYARWGEAANRWQINSFVTAADAKSDTVVDGKPLREWLKNGGNIFDDYTLENHDRVHPDYMGTIRLTMHQKLLYDWAGNPPPQALNFNTKQIYANLKKLALPDGNFVYPSGQDWQIHRNADWMDLNTLMTLTFNDPQAARLMRISLETAEKMIGRSSDGPIHPPQEIIVITSHSIFMESYADAYLHMRAMGEGPESVSEDQLWRDLAGDHRFGEGEFCVMRTPTSIATFSWGAKKMAMVMPLRKDMLLTPNERSLVGIVIGPDGKDDIALKDWNEIQREEFHAFTGSFLRAGKQVEQRFGFVVLKDGRTIWADLLRQTESAAPKEVQLGTLGVLNDTEWVYHNGRRTLRYQGGEQVFEASKAKDDKARIMSSKWYNLDDLGIVCLKTSERQVYDPQPSKRGASGRLQQIFCLNQATAPAQTVLAFYPNQSADNTKRTAEKCKFVAGSEVGQFKVALEDGTTVAIDLNRLEVSIP